MRDDQILLAAKLDRLAAEAACLADQVRRLGRVGEPLDDLREGLFLTVAQAATICAVTDQAIYNWVDHAARMRRPIAEKRAAVWIIDTARLLAYVEKYRGGVSAKLKAAARLKELWPIWTRTE
jgi:hypothetical protein